MLLMTVFGIDTMGIIKGMDFAGSGVVLVWLVFHAVYPDIPRPRWL